jgi:OFA family oxalate/formate antiporter-like MFS transporter
MAQAEVATSKPDLAKQLYGPIAGNRWIQLIAGIVGMIVISNYQYAFTLFTPGIKQQFPDVPYSQIAAIFSLFIVFETWPVPVAGILIDKFGIRKLMIIGAIGVLAGWVLGGTVATSVFHLYIFYGVIAGTSAGIIYIATVANAIKWFPDKRGLAAGLTAAGFGGGAALTLIPINATITSLGWAHAMAVWGAAQGIIAIIAALVLHHPPVGWSPAGWVSRAGQVTQKVAQSRVEYKWTETLRRPEFYLMYVMLLFVATGGLMTTGNLSQIAKSLNVFDAKIWGIAVVPFTATIAGITNAGSRIMWGAVSDKYGREYTMAFAFALEATLIFLVTQITGYPILFVILLPFVFLAWGEIYALFSALTGDVFGPKNATANYGMLYTAKGLASILAGFGAAAVAAAYAGSFAVPYYVAASFDVVAAVLALFFLRPLVRSRIAREVTGEPAAVGVPLMAAPAVEMAVGTSNPGSETTK